MLRTIARSGLLAPQPPLGLVRAGFDLRRWGATMAGGFVTAASRHPDRVCVIDERGQLTWREVDERSNALANGLAAHGVVEGDVVAVLCRNSRAFVEVSAALAKLGAAALELNTGFAGPQLREVMAREGARALIHDDEYTQLVADGADVPLVIVAWPEARTDRLTLDHLIATHPTRAPVPPGRPGRTIILTSGTTGLPKGASRPQSTGAETGLSLLDRIPYRTGETVVVPAPLFHSWGYGNMSLGLLLGSTFVLRRRFDPETTLADVARHRAQVLVAVPVMLQRILELPLAVLRRYDTRSLRIVPLSGSAIPGDLATRWMDAMGDNLYNLYGSTEVGWATIATPADLRADPHTAGRPPFGTSVRILDDDGHDVAPGESGRIFVGNGLLFDGYTGGGSKPIVDGLMGTGDTGRLGDDGRLRVEGRDDDMIVSGGENVMPGEIEDLLATHPAVVEVAVVGVDDVEFGQRLRAVVVRRPGTALAEDDLRAMVRAELAGFKVPRDVVFVDALPRNSTGKVLRGQLR